MDETVERGRAKVASFARGVFGSVQNGRLSSGLGPDALFAWEVGCVNVQVHFGWQATHAGAVALWRSSPEFGNDGVAAQLYAFGAVGDDEYLDLYAHLLRDRDVLGFVRWGANVADMSDTDAVLSTCLEVLLQHARTVFEPKLITERFDDGALALRYVDRSGDQRTLMAGETHRLLRELWEATRVKVTVCAGLAVLAQVMFNDRNGGDVYRGVVLPPVHFHDA